MKTIQYTWKSVVTGGGGFVPGIIFHPAEKGLIYLRTDMGGAYRRDKRSEKWVCITDMFGKAEAEYNGVLGMAVDPRDADTVYMMNGKYTHKHACAGAFHASNDRGFTWKRSLLPFKVGGNEKGRGCGERLSVNPSNNSEIIMGSTTHGLWMSGNKGKSWARLRKFKPLNVNFTAYHENQGKTIIFAAAADAPGKSLHVSRDNGKTWDVIPGQPRGLIAMRAGINGARLFVTFSDSQGPYGVKSGLFWMYDIDKDKWTDMKPPAGEGGFSGVAIDSHNPDRLVVATLNRAKPHDDIYRTFDAGKTWEPLIRSSAWDRSYAAYTNTLTPHWMADVKIDPFNPDHAMFVTGYGIWSTRGLFSKSLTWFFDNKGLEETVPMQLITPGKGARVLSAMGDVDGFKHDDLKKSPDARFDPWRGTTLAIAFAENKPLKIVKAYNSRPPYGAYSEDGGKSWIDFKTCPKGIRRGGIRSIAISCDGKSVVWSPEGADMSYSQDNGYTWFKCKSSAKNGLWPMADRVNPNKFYLYDGVKGILYISSDKGVSFSAASSLSGKEKKYPGGDGMAEYSAATTPGHEGDLWLAAGSGGLFHFINGRAVKIKGVACAFRVGFGRAKNKGGYPSIYMWATISGQTGFFRSDNEGRSWARINDGRHQYGWIHDITGDPNVFGRCYIGAEGRGILYGEQF